MNMKKKKEYELTRQIESIKEISKTIEESSKKLSVENEIMRKYYRLDSEPTDEEKIKIRINLRIHELEMQIIKERIESLERSRTFISLSATPYNSVSGPYGFCPECSWVLGPGERPLTFAGIEDQMLKRE